MWFSLASRRTCDGVPGPMMDGGICVSRCWPSDVCRRLHCPVQEHETKMQTRASRNPVRGNHQILSFGDLVRVFIVLVRQQKGNICTPSSTCVQNPSRTSTRSLDPCLWLRISTRHKAVPRVYSYRWSSQMFLDNDKALGEEVHALSRRKYWDDADWHGSNFAFSPHR